MLMSILGNTIILAFETPLNSESTHRLLLRFNDGFTLIFLIEAALKVGLLCALCPEFVDDGSNTAWIFSVELEHF
jgi:hypothetical protein